MDAQQNVINGPPLDGSTDAADIEIAVYRGSILRQRSGATRRGRPPNRAGRARREFPLRSADDEGQAVRTGRVGEAECCRRNGSFACVPPFDVPEDARAAGTDRFDKGEADVNVRRSDFLEDAVGHRQTIRPAVCDPLVVDGDVLPTVRPQQIRKEPVERPLPEGRREAVFLSRQIAQRDNEGKYGRIFLG